MRKLFYLALLLVLPILLFAQDTGTGTGTDFLNGFLSLTSLSALVLTVTEFIKNVTGKKTQYMSWLISVVLGIIGYIFNLGIFDHVIWWHGLIYALSAGLMANGIFSWEFIQVILAFLKINPVLRK